jgi:hypothetical protein
MDAPTSEVGYTSATTRRGTMKSKRDMWWYWGKKLGKRVRKFLKATGNTVISICPAVLPKKQLRSKWKDYCEFYVVQFWMNIILLRIFGQWNVILFSVHFNAARSESRCALIKGVGSDEEPQWVKTELNNYTLYRYWTSTAV